MAERKKSIDSLLESNVKNVNWNLNVSELIQKTIISKQGKLTSSGALACDTGVFTGRSPKDKYIVRDENTENTVWWGDVNNEFSVENYNTLYARMQAFMKDKEIYVKDCIACSIDKYKLNIRLISETAWHSLFAHNLFLRLSKSELENFIADWNIICLPNFLAVPDIDKTRSSNFTVINFTTKVILIGGSAYTGEIKKGIFTVLNFLLPTKYKALSMHCSANIGQKNDTAIFFGLSGTGKTTLSADPNRVLIGDDEHGWDDSSVFNFEGGCYAKCVNLSQEKEPQIFNAIRYGTLLENVIFYKNTDVVDYQNTEITENTRAAYPLHFIPNSVSPSIGYPPKNIFFLTADAFGVLPPISKLSSSQAMYHFISGYTAKVAGTEAGITEPQVTFSACFGKPFLPIHPTKYAELLGNKLKENEVNVWLVNTGWSGGSYGVGDRIKLEYTRAMISSALNGILANVDFERESFFGLEIPKICPNVPSEILNPMNPWSDKKSYNDTAIKLANAFKENFELYRENASIEIINGGPIV